MWPLLILSIVTLAVVLERLVFLLTVNRNLAPDTVEALLEAVELGDLPRAQVIGNGSKDYVCRTLSYALTHRGNVFTPALLRAAAVELNRFNRGLSFLDTSITLAPLLGLLGTVTGMIHAFGMLGTQELSAPVAITGGIAQALLATAFGLGIAIVSLIPFNILNSKAEQARHAIEDAGTRLELLLHPNATIGITQR